MNVSSVRSRPGWPTMCFVLVQLVMVGCGQPNYEAGERIDAPQEYSDSPEVVPETPGDLSETGGTRTLREDFTAQEDDPDTTNDESNDQPQGNFGTFTLRVHNLSSGNSYSLDADLSDFSVSRLYFPKGGWVDFPGCELETDLTGSCEDENGNGWEFLGE